MFFNKNVHYERKCIEPANGDIGKLNCTITKGKVVVGGIILIWRTIILEEKTLSSFEKPN